MNNFLAGKRVLVTGVCGTVGKEIVQLLLSGEFGELAELVGIDNNESELFFVSQEFNQSNAHFFLRDLRDFAGLYEVGSCSQIGGAWCGISTGMVVQKHD